MESHLIRPAPGWTDWDERAAAVHRIGRNEFHLRGEPHEQVARLLLTRLRGHDLCASAPSWDGKWLSVLLRSAGLPRHALRLRDSDDVRADAAREIFAAKLTSDRLEAAVVQTLEAARAEVDARPPAHRAGEDARRELEEFTLVVKLARLVSA